MAGVIYGDQGGKVCFPIFRIGWEMPEIFGGNC